MTKAEHSKEPYKFETELIEVGGVWYTRDTARPYSGKMISLHENGEKNEEGTFKDGKREGLETVWYENGNKFQEEIFKDGVLHDEYTGWYENGNKKWEGTYKDGEKTGKWTHYNEDGTIDEVEEY